MSRQGYGAYVRSHVLQGEPSGQHTLRGLPSQKGKRKEDDAKVLTNNERHPDSLLAALLPVVLQVKVHSAAAAP